jgi:magnesium-transporting ATPase (P-type)
VRSGPARVVIVTTALRTQFGVIASRLTLRRPETEFDRGIRHFGYLLTRGVGAAAECDREPRERILLVVFQATPALFRTGWFVQSLLTELVIALVVRTRRPFFRSRPRSLLLWSSLVLIVLTCAIPYLLLAAALGFVPLPAVLLLTVAAITALYILAAELTKHWFYRPGLFHHDQNHPRPVPN